MYKLVYSILFCVISIVGGCGDNTLVLDSPEGFSMSDSEWLNLSQTAFAKAGFNLTEYRPVKSMYDGHNYSYFAKNVQNPRRGYVIWESIANPSALSYTVYLERKDNKIHCKISKTKG
jgi:hypothetical protein